MYKKIVLIVIYFESFPVHITSTNEPNKSQITRLIKDVSEKLKIDGDLIYKEFKQEKDFKIYSFTLDKLNINVNVTRLPIISFEKNKDHYEYTHLEL